MSVLTWGGPQASLHWLQFPAYHLFFTCGVSRGSKMLVSGGQPVMPPLLQTDAGEAAGRSSAPNSGSSQPQAPCSSLLVSQCQFPGSPRLLRAHQTITKLRKLLLQELAVPVWSSPPLFLEVVKVTAGVFFGNCTPS